MYLTRMRINTARREAGRLLGRPGAMHAAVMHAFPEPETQTRDGARILWRLDRNARHDAVLYMVSPDEPDLTHLVEQAGWPAGDTAWESRPYDGLLDALKEHQRWAFRLTANPTRYGRHPKKDGEPYRPFSHVTVEQQTDWLRQKAAAHGFAIADGDAGAPNLAVTRRDQHRFRRGDAAEPVTIGTATFDGVLEITDTGAFRAALIGGIGRAKAYGCGLLTVAPTR